MASTTLRRRRNQGPFITPTTQSYSSFIIPLHLLLLMLRLLLLLLLLQLLLLLLLLLLRLLLVPAVLVVLGILGTCKSEWYFTWHQPPSAAAAVAAWRRG